LLPKQQVKEHSAIVCSKMETLGGAWKKEKNIQQNLEKNAVRRDPR
jgi:hypothetical protein